MSSVKVFKVPKGSLGDLDAETAATLIAAASDISLVVDGNGVIQDTAFQNSDLSLELNDGGRWFGRRWVDLVAEESRTKTAELLQEASARGVSRWRQIKHFTSQGGDVPILYCAVRIRPGGPFVAVGRDQRAMATLQQRLVEAQMSMERDYSRLRHTETRYRMLFQTSSEPALIVDAATLKIVEANPAAIRVFGDSTGRIIGKPFPDGLDFDDADAVRERLTAQRGSRADAGTVRLKRDGEEFFAHITMFRQEAVSFLLLRFTASRDNVVALPHYRSSLLTFVDNAPDAFVLTDNQGRIRTANSSFLEMVQLPSEDEIRGEPIDRWLGRTGVEVGVLLANLRQHGTVRMFATRIRGEFGAPTDVELSGATVKDGDTTNYGFVIRNVSRRIPADVTAPHELPRSVQQLTELVGRTPLKELVRETTDVMERLCIEAALELTRDNRASAAEMLGLSRQSLYVKLRRFGMLDGAPEDLEAK